MRYDSARQTIIALSNQTPTPLPHHRDPKITFNRYFRLGRYSKAAPQLDTLALFSPKLTVEAPKVRIKGSPDISIAAPQVGIDLAKRGHEVRKLFYAGYGRRVLKYGYDPEDVLQEVYKGLLVRNQGKCPFNPDKSSFGHYVHMVCGCIVSNYHRRYSRLNRNEQFGVLSMNDDDIEMVDVRESSLVVEPAMQPGILDSASMHDTLSAMVSERASLSDVPSDLATLCFNLMVSGYRRGEIAEQTGQSLNTISKVLKMIRTVAAEWRDHVGI
jgi:DNA-directed RNA polymerase specialized sigma24 family protein